MYSNRHLIMGNILSKYLNKEIGKEETIESLINNFSLEEILGTNDELLIDSFFAIKQMTEVGFETTNSELVYLKNCFDGRSIFSRVDKGKFIINNIERLK